MCAQVSKTFYKSLLEESTYQGEDYDEFANWFAQTKE